MALVTEIICLSKEQGQAGQWQSELAPVIMSPPRHGRTTFRAKSP